jgi:hypothetical protein
MRIRQHLVWTIFCGALAIWATSRTWGFEEGGRPIGLNGILPAYAPDGLSDADFEDLAAAIDETWKSWVLEAGSFVKDLYEGDHPTIESQQEALQRVAVKVHTLEKALSEQDYDSIRPQLVSLYGKLGPRVDLAQAMLETLTMDPTTARTQRMQPAFNELHAAVSHLQDDLKAYQHAPTWYAWAQLDQLRALQPNTPHALESVSAVKQKLQNRENYSPEVKDFVSREPFLKLEDALGLVLQSADQKAADPAALRTQFQQLLNALQDYRDDPSTPGEAHIRQLLDELRTSAPDGGVAIADAVRKGYLNYNLRIVASEGLLNRFFSETRKETSTISDHVMEATVCGTQTSSVVTKLDLLPSELNARFALTLSGTVRTNTNGYTSQATVHTVGCHTFTGQKEILFDGQQFVVEDSHVSARANNQTVGARTKFSSVPLLGRIANKIAIREANSRSPQTNALTARKISSRVQEDLDEEAAEQFANATRDLQANTYGPLRRYGLYPDVMSLSSTHNDMFLRTRTMNGREIGGSNAIPYSNIPGDGLVAQIHESLLNHAFDRIASDINGEKGLKGQTLSDEEVRHLLEKRISELLNRQVSFPEPENAGTDEQAANKFVFAEEDPVRFTIENGVVTLFIKAGLDLANGQTIPTQIISVPFRATIQGDQIQLTRGGNVGVKGIVRASNAREQIIRAQIMRQKIDSSLPPRNIAGTFEIAQGDRKIKLTITELTAESGWLLIELR